MRSERINRERRSFLKLSGLLGVGSLAAYLLPPEAADAFLFKKKAYKISKTRLAMGTFVAMTAIHPSRDHAEDAFGRAFEEVFRLSNLLSRHAVASPVYHLNETGQLEDSPPELLEVVSRSLDYFHETRGSFDITVKPFLDLYEACFDRNVVPSMKQVAAVQDRIGSDHLIIKERTISFERDEMAITLDGIAKGYIVDQASRILTESGITNHLINAGGDIRTAGSAAKGRKWSVAIQDPNKDGAYPDIITLSNGSIATSGNYEVFYDREKLFHHIITPATGLSPQLSASVSVIAPTVMDADALSTAVFVQEPEPGTAFINGRSSCESFVIDRGGNYHRSSGWHPTP